VKRESFKTNCKMPNKSFFETQNVKIKL